MGKAYDVIVIGAGHAGVEAALSAARMGATVAMINIKKETIGLMSCNPAIGGVGKGQIVKEVDALGGEMGLAADRTAIQFRQLNASKGQAVRSSRCQSDRKRYQAYMQAVICGHKNITLVEDMAAEVLVKNGGVIGVKTEAGIDIDARSVIVASGTFLNGRMHIGKTIIEGGRVNEPASVRLAHNLKSLGFEMVSFKTGTPPRIDGKSLDFSKMNIQHSDEVPVPFSFRTKHIPKDQKLLPCYITSTTQETHRIIQENFHLSPMYSGQIDATGVRYCPSIEDKLKKFPDKGSHQVFLEPDGLDTNVYYPNGVSTGLPKEVQLAMIHSIPGMEHAVILQPGYSIEHGAFPPTQIRPSLETKIIKGLFFAGQVNGTTGYEEAAGQGIVAGINAVLSVRGEEPFILDRHEAYIGVLIDDLVTKGTQEPYRMFTSRVEHRLIVREDNADRRMAAYAKTFGLIPDQRYSEVMTAYDNVEKEITHLKANIFYPSSAEGKTLSQKLESLGTTALARPLSLADVLKRPQVAYQDIREFGGSLSGEQQKEISQVEYEIKYEGFIQRQKQDIEKMQHIEHIRIPDDCHFSEIPGLSIEIQQKLAQCSPKTLGQAQRISGVTPAAISILMVYLKKLSLERSSKKD